MKKLAFCFLIYDSINHEELWNRFFKDVDPSKYNIYIHYKTDKPLKYFDKYKLKKCVPTKYGDISLVIAQNIMLKEAVKDADNQHFIFVSNSCIPLKSFAHIYNTLKDNYSYFNMSPQSQCFPRCNVARQVLEEQYIQKASQWCILNRKHTELMLASSKYLTWFRDIPDEHAYISNLFVNHLEKELITTPNLPDGATTFTNWEGMPYKYPSPKNLKNYSKISEEELIYLLNSRSLFGRKFAPECDLMMSSYIEAITKIE